MRAIENRVSIVRCANTGISSFYDPAGKMYQSTELFTRAIVSGFISLATAQTPYSKYGDILLYVSYPFMIVLFLYIILTRKRR